MEGHLNNSSHGQVLVRKLKKIFFDKSGKANTGVALARDCLHG